MRRILLSLLASTMPAHAAGAIETTQPLRRGVVAVPFQRHFDACSLPGPSATYEVRMHADGRVLLYVGARSPARRTDNAVAAFENCLRRYGQQR